MARSSHRKTPIAPHRLILDSGAVVSWSRGEPRVRSLLTRAVELGADVRIPVAVLAETLRGGPRDAPVHRVRNACDVLPTHEDVGRLAGALLGRTSGTNTVDALVAAEAIVAKADVLTTDVADLRRLLARHPPVSLIEV
jgi:predicted nucleic acid-binding protein